MLTLKQEPSNARCHHPLLDAASPKPLSPMSPKAFKANPSAPSFALSPAAAVDIN